MLPSYSNFCRVTATPEEVILDFGLNPQPFATGRQDVKAIQRIVMNFYTSKRLLTALGMTIQRHEGTFGAIELDVRRRAGTAQRRPGRAARDAAPPVPRGSSSSGTPARPTPPADRARTDLGTIGRGPRFQVRCLDPISSGRRTRARSRPPRRSPRDDLRERLPLFGNLRARFGPIPILKGGPHTPIAPVDGIAPRDLSHS